MRILYISRAAPNENGRGVDRRAAQHLRALRRLGTVTLVVPDRSVEEARAIGWHEDSLDVESLIVRPDATVIQRRLERYYLERGRLKRLWHASRITHWVDQRPFAADARAAKAALTGRFDLLFAFRMSSAVWAEHVLKADLPAARVVDFDDIESLALSRSKQAGNFIDRAIRRRAIKWLATTEKRILRQWPTVTVCSEVDAERLLSTSGHRPSVIPNTVKTELHPTAKERRVHSHGSDADVNVLFVATLNYLPNIEGLMWFCDHIWPQVAAHFAGGLKLCIVGIDAPEEVRRLGERPGVEFIGAVPNLQPYYQNAVAAIVPILSGSGTRIKILEAMSFGVPVVTTAIGCEGIGLTPGVDALVHDDAAGFQKGLIDLIEDQDLQLTLGQQGQRFCNAHFGEGAAFKATQKAVLDTLDRPSAS